MLKLHRLDGIALDRRESHGQLAGIRNDHLVRFAEGFGGLGRFVEFVREDLASNGNPFDDSADTGAAFLDTGKLSRNLVADLGVCAAERHSAVLLAIRRGVSELRVGSEVDASDCSRGHPRAGQHLRTDSQLAPDGLHDARLVLLLLLISEELLECLFLFVNPEDLVRIVSLRGNLRTGQRGICLSLLAICERLDTAVGNGFGFASVSRDFQHHFRLRYLLGDLFDFSAPCRTPWVSAVKGTTTLPPLALLPFPMDFSLDGVGGNTVHLRHNACAEA